MLQAVPKASPQRMLHEEIASELGFLQDEVNRLQMFFLKLTGTPHPPTPLRDNPPDLSFSEVFPGIVPSLLNLRAQVANLTECFIQLLTTGTSGPLQGK